MSWVHIRSASEKGSNEYHNMFSWQSKKNLYIWMLLLSRALYNVLYIDCTLKLPIWKCDIYIFTGSVMVLLRISIVRRQNMNIDVLYSQACTVSSWSRPWECHILASLFCHNFQCIISTQLNSKWPSMKYFIGTSAMDAYPLNCCRWNLTLNQLNLKISSWHFKMFLFIPENRCWYFVWIVSTRDILFHVNCLQERFFSWNNWLAFK